MSVVEWTAFMHGVWFDELADWRMNGRPTVCAQCTGPLSIGGGGWYAREGMCNRHELVHTSCLHERDVRPD